MPDKISIDEELKLLTILSYGKVTSDDISESIDTLTKLFHEGKIDKVLVDTTKQESVPSFSKLFTLSERFPPGLKIALFATKEQLTYVNLDFFELTSKNKHKMVQVFNSISEAKEWLHI